MERQMYGAARTLPGRSRPRRSRGHARDRSSSAPPCARSGGRLDVGGRGRGRPQAPCGSREPGVERPAPGQAGGVAFTRNSTDQIALYEGLTRLRDNVTDADLRRYFKRETLGLAPGDKAVGVERPRAGVTITRDRWGVPHVKGTTAEDVAFGAGWATAADRQLIMELLRGPGRIAALDAPGVNAFSLALSGRQFRPSAADRGASRPAVRPASRAGREGPPGDPDHRRVRRGHQRGVPEGGPADRALDPERRRRGRRPDRRGLRRRRRRRGAPLAVPRPAPAKARPGARDGRSGRTCASATTRRPTSPFPDGSRTARAPRARWATSSSTFPR